MASEPGIWFVYRSHYEGPLSRRIRRLNAPSILEWFRSKIREARQAEKPDEITDEELGGDVYGLGSFFDAAKDQGFALPRSMGGLRELLDKHLYVEGGPGNIRMDAHTLRVKTDDDEVDLAYFFFDDLAEQHHPDRLTYLLQEDPHLPDGAVDAGFVPPMELDQWLPGGAGAGATYACLLTFYDSDSLPGDCGVFPGVRLPELAAHLRQVIPHSEPQPWSAEWLKSWPLELRLLRAMVDAGDSTIEAALGRANSFPIRHIASSTNHSRLGVGAHELARDEFLAAAVPDREWGRGDPSLSIIHQSEHVAVLCAHATSHFGYQQWILFDDLWAGAHPELASSLLWYASRWDPFFGLEVRDTKKRKRT